jgi:RND family efflux transporter MFP subunit
MKKKRPPRRIKRLFAMCLLVLPLTMGCGSGSEDLQERRQDAVPVETQVASLTPYSHRITCTGTLSGIREATVSSQLAAEVRHVAVELGDDVRAGELLVQLDDDLYRDKLRQAEAELLSAEASWELARSDLVRHEELFEKGHLSQGEVEAFRARAKAAEAGHLGAKAALESAQHQFKDTRIVSPIDGRVSAVLVELGETVGPGSPVTMVVEIDSVEVTAGLPEEDVVKARPGMEADVHVAALGEQGFAGRVAAVGPMARMDTGTFPVEIHLANPDHRLLPGMVAKVELVSETTRSVIWVPRDAVVWQYGQPVLFVVEDEKAIRRSVSLGVEEEGGVEVTEGLDSGDEVVVLGQNNLQDGTPVVVRGKVAS